jgi:hypothetical protein
MLSAREEAFLTFWEKERITQNSFWSKLSRGFPMAMIFGLPIIFSVVVVYLYFPEWYTKISKTTSGSFITVVIAVLIAVLFFSYFRMHFKWEMNEQLYHELIHKKQKSASNK